MGQRYEHFSILQYNLQIFRTLEKDTLQTVSSLLEKLEFKCKWRGMETCLHSRGAALNARETGIYSISLIIVMGHSHLAYYTIIYMKYDTLYDSSDEMSLWRMKSLLLHFRMSRTYKSKCQLFLYGSLYSILRTFR